MEDGFETASVKVRIAGPCLVFVHGPVAPTDAEWDRAMDLWARIGTARVRALVFTEGGAPNAAQRAKLAKISGDRKPPISVLTESALARAAGTAISWFNAELRVFPPTDVERALDHLSLSGTDREKALATLTELRARRVGTSSAR